MDQISFLRTLLMADPLRRRALNEVAALDLPDCWIGAGFIRDALWDHLHGYKVSAPQGDVDVVWHCRVSPHDGVDHLIEQRLAEKLPNLQWSVKNQARMHLRNGDDPYRSVANAMEYWPETATAVAARRGPFGTIEINAPFGLDDLLGLQLRPTPRFLSDKLPIFLERVSSKRWLERYPKLSFQTADMKSM